MTTYPEDWYWLSDDDRVYSAPIQNVVTTSDTGYIQFLNDGYVPTRWPEALSGEQTEEALDEVINPLGLYRDPKIELKIYAGNKRWQVEGRGIMSGAYPLRTDADSQRKVAILDSNFRNGVITGTIQFKLADDTFIAATATNIANFNLAISTHVQNCYNAEKNANTAITAGTCTTHEEVDAFFAGIPT